jgi:hypothetical protein
MQAPTPLNPFHLAAPLVGAWDMARTIPFTNGKPYIARA